MKSSAVKVRTVLKFCGGTTSMNDTFLSYKAHTSLSVRKHSSGNSKNSPSGSFLYINANCATMSDRRRPRGDVVAAGDEGITYCTLNKEKKKNLTTIPNELLTDDVASPLSQRVRKIVDAFDEPRWEAFILFSFTPGDIMWKRR